MANTTEIKHYDHVNGLGTISFSSELITSIIKQVLKAYPKYIYKTHSITSISKRYLEVSVELKLVSSDLNMKEIDRVQKELVLALRQSLNLTCALFINIHHD